jgi:hypothetical protein
MVKQADTRVPRSVLPQLAKLLEWRWRVDKESAANARLLLANVRTIARELNAIKIRIARVLECAGRWDVSEVGCPNWRAFLKEYAPWSPAQARVWLRIVKSRLFVVLEALQNSQITVDQATRAVRALGKDASEEAQRGFLLDLPPDSSEQDLSRHRASMDCLTGEDRLCVLEARKLGGTLIGSDAPVSVVDRFLLDCHARKRTGEEIVEDGRADPPVPDRLGEVIPDWTVDPAEGLLGKWIAPADIRQAAAQLRRLEWLLAMRRMALARAYWFIRHYALWTDLPDCGSLEECCVTYLGMSRRTLERYSNEGLRHEWFPNVRKEVAAGRLTIDRANYALSHSTNEHALDLWLDFLKQVGRAELQHAEQEYAEEDLRKLYAPALAFAKEVRARSKEATRTGAEGSRAGATRTSADGSGAEATRTSATAGRVASYLRQVGSGGQIQVSLRDGCHAPSPPREPGYLLAPRGLLEAAKYVVSVVVLPPTYGVRKTVSKDRFTCQNPRCRVRCLRVHPHHMHQRQHGGTDDPWNLITLCPACHLRGIHSDRMAVVRFDDFLVWTWSCDDTAVVMYSPVKEVLTT